jgi:hypothetical protein
VGQSPLPGGLCVRTPLLSALVIAVLAAAGCATESAEERTSDDVAREFVEGLDESLIWFNIRAETPESLHELGGPCDSSSDDYAVLENVLALLRNVVYEARAPDVSYAFEVVEINAGRPVECAG